MRLSTENHKFKARTARSRVPSTSQGAESGGNGNIDPGDIVTLTIRLRNYVTNPLNAAQAARRRRAADDEHAWRGRRRPEAVNYKNIDPGETEVNRITFVLADQPVVRPRHADRAGVESASAEHGGIDAAPHAVHRHAAGDDDPRENFNAAAPGALPAGWTAVARRAAPTPCPWTTSSTFCGTTSNAAFHQNAADGPGPGPFTNTRFERLFSPAFVVPGDAEYVTIDMDVCYDTEDDPNFNILAYDGLLLRIADLTPGRLLRSVLSRRSRTSSRRARSSTIRSICRAAARRTSRTCRSGRANPRLQARADAAARHGRQHGPTAVRIRAGRHRHLQRRPAGSFLRSLGRQHRREEREVGGAIAGATDTLDLIPCASTCRPVNM